MVSAFLFFVHTITTFIHIKNIKIMHLPIRQYTTLEWYEYNNYAMNNTAETQLTIDEYFAQQEGNAGPSEDIAALSAEERINFILDQMNELSEKGIIPESTKIFVPRDQSTGDKGVIHQLRLAGLFVSDLQPGLTPDDEDHTWVYVTREQDQADKLIAEEGVSFGKYPERAEN